MGLDRLTIHPAQERDLLGLLSIKPDEILHRERLARQERGEVVYLVAGDAQRPVLGYVLLKWLGDAHHDAYPILEDLLVRPDYRSQGIGTRLLQHAETLCRERGLSHLGLGVNPIDNPRALSLYERLGYQDAGEPPQYDVYASVDETGQRHFYEDCCIRLVKTL